MPAGASVSSEAVDDPVRAFVVDDHGMVRRGVRAYLSIFEELEVVGDCGGAAACWS